MVKSIEETGVHKLHKRDANWWDSGGHARREMKLGFPAIVGAGEGELGY